MGSYNIFYIFYAVGFGAIGWGLACLFRSLIASNWPSVPGDIRICEIKKKLDVDVGTIYHLHVRYSFKVNNRPHRGNRIAYGYSASNKYAEHAILYDMLSRAQYISVRYNPSNPADSVLISGLNPFIVRIILFGLIWISFVLGFTIFTPFSSWSITLSAPWNLILESALYILLFVTFVFWALTRNTDQIMFERLRDSIA
jgi:hypothetical protein